MNKIINKIYIVENTINQKNINSDNLENLINSADIEKLKKKLPKISIEKWKQFDKKLTDIDIKKISTTLGSNFCSNKKINEWLTHYKLWKNIIKNKEDRVLILSNNISLTDNFLYKFNKWWNQIPHDWDIVYLGCNGSCNESNLVHTYYSFNGINNDNIDYNLIKPGCPLGLFAYTITYDCAKKLTNHKKFKKIQKNGLDYCIVNNIVYDKNFNVYAFVPSLVNLKKKENSIKQQEIIEPLISNIKYRKGATFNDILKSEFIYIRIFNLVINYYSILFIIISFLIGLKCTKKLQNIFLISIIFLHLFEFGFTKLNLDKTKTLLFQIVSIIITLLASSKIKKYLI